ncbi:unnamed protein product [Brugia pahangi]|uniref:Dolichyl-diphosphooligosaccharide--protein glycosyltransferase subunit 4 n=1 Tax=Brugia pahangi TaxID=6280 RepID=A0A0N4SYW6_BRUPA|nr:unnamed protein product [Brugia pahangi]
MITDVQLAVFSNLIGVSIFALVILFHYVAVNNPKRKCLMIPSSSVCYFGSTDFLNWVKFMLELVIKRLVDNPVGEASTSCHCRALTSRAKYDQFGLDYR